jgi:hypothetical protein
LGLNFNRRHLLGLTISLLLLDLIIPLKTNFSFLAS